MRLHLFGAALAPGEATAEWGNATPFEGSDAFGVFHVADIADDTKQVGFMCPGGRRTAPTPRTPTPTASSCRWSAPHVNVTQGQPEFDCEATARE